MKYPETTLYLALSLTSDMPNTLGGPQYRPMGQTFCGVPLPNTLGDPQYLPQPQPLHFVVGRLPPVVEREKFDHIEERQRAIEGSGDYAFADMA